MNQIYGKTFGMHRPAHYLDKLEWEYEQLMKAGSKATIEELSYHTLNFLITAWHMTDWTYPHLCGEEKEKFPKLKFFQDWVKEQSREVAATRDLATGGKHQTVRDAPDPRIEVVSVTKFQLGADERVIGDVWHIAIDGVLWSPEKFCQRIITFWHGVLDMNGLLDE